MKQILSNKTSYLQINGSKFYAYSFEIDDDESAKKHIEKLRDDNKKAVHVCYGYVLKKDNQIIQRFNDDGEPKNSAGKKILQALLDLDFINSLIVVVRYKSKSMLGLGLLTRSYYNVALDLVKNDENWIEFIEKEFMEIFLGSEKEKNAILNYLKSNNISYQIDYINKKISCYLNKQQKEKLISFCL